MANFFDQFDSGASAGASSSNFFDQFDEGSQQPKPTQNVLTDTAQDVIQGALRIPGAITGLADIPAGLMGFNRPFDRATDYIGEKTGIQPGKLADSIQANNYSPERVAANQRLDQTWQDYQSDKIGLGEALADTVTNPRALLGNVVGSVPSMYAGGMLGNAARAAGLVSKAAVPFVGEGAVMAGQAMDNIDASVDPQKAAILSAATGLGGGLLARGGGKLSEKMGLVDPDVAIANGLSQTATKAPMGLGARTAGGFLAEGAMEELPQSLMEQGLQNYAEDKPLTEGMARAGVEGLLSGGLMGAGFNAFPQSTPKVVEKPISDGPLGNAAAAGGITQTEISDAGTTNQEALIPEQNLGGSSGAVLPASNGLGESNDAMPEPEPLVDQTGAATTGNEAESALATQQAPSPVDFQPTHLSDDGTPVAYREDDQGPYFETADGQQWNYTDTATPIKQEVQNANSPTGSVAENNPPITGQDSGTGSDQRGFDTSIEPTDGRVDDRGISGADGQLRGAESPSDVESGGALNAESSSQNTDAFRELSTRDGSAEQITPNLSPDGLPVTGESTGNTDSASVQNETSSPVNRQYLLDQGVTESDISRIDQALNNNPGLAQKPLGFIRGFLKDKYQGLDYSQVIQDVSTQQSPASSLDAITTQSQPDVGFVSSQPGNLNAQTPKTQPVLPNTGADQTRNAAPMGVGQGQSAVSGQEEVRFNSNKGKHPAAETELPKQVLGGAIPKGWENLNTLRGRVVTAKTHDGEVFTDGKTIIPALPSVKNTVSGVKSATVTQGDKFNSVRAINQQLQRSLPNMDNDVDEYWEPYSASLIFALNLSHLQNTNKPVNLNVSSVYEPVKSPVYKGLKGNPVVQLKTGEQMNYRDAYVRGIETMDDVGHEEIDRFVAEIRRNHKKAPLRFESAKDSAKNVVALLSRDNVVLHDSEDNDFIEKARQSAMSGKRLAFIDDSNYALMQNESPSDVYDGSVSPKQQSLFDSVAKGQKFEPRNTNYLLAQKQAAYDAISKNGVIVATNHYTQPLVDFLRRYNPQMYGFKQYSQWTKDSEYGYLNTYRPEYLAIIGAQGESNVRDYQNPRQLLVARYRSDAEKVSASGNGSGVTAGSGLSRRFARGDSVGGGRESVGNSLPNPEAGRSNIDSGNSTGRESTGAGRGGIKLSVANKPTLTALFNQLGKLKAAEKANKDVKALIDAHPKAELIRHVQNHWTDVLVQHEKNSDNPNGKVTIQC